jgi:hypothetical protein
VDATNAQGHRLGQILPYPRLNEVDKYLDWRIASRKPGRHSVTQLRRSR